MEIGSGEFEDMNCGDEFTEIRSDIMSNDDEKGEPEQKKEPKKVIMQKSRKNGCFFRAVWIVLLVFVSVLLTRYVLEGINDMLAIGKDENIVSIEIPKDASIDTVARILKSKGIIDEEQFFKVYAIATKSSKGFAQGIYELRPNMDYEAILNYLRNQTNNKDVVEVTFREGMNVMECADLLEQNQVCEKQEFLDMCNSDEFDDKYDFLKGITNKSDRYYKLEGYLFPDTYEFYRGESAKESIKRFLGNFQRKVIRRNQLKGYDKKVSIREVAEESGKTLEQVINIASLVQAEAANKEDMLNVSSVIYNRLSVIDSGGKTPFGEFDLGTLRIDSTVWYPYRVRSVVPQDIVDSFKSKFNTYEIKGLPAGPICNPGMDAIYATLKPSKTNYYYFCHSASGEAYYAKTNDVHIANLKKAGLI